MVRGEIIDYWDEWDATGEPTKRAGVVKRTISRIKSKARKIKNSMHFFFVKLRINERRYTQLLQDANMWYLVSGAIKCHTETETVEVKGKYNATLIQFEKQRDYTLEIDAGKIRDVFFKTDLPVKISIKE